MTASSSSSTFDRESRDHRPPYYSHHADNNSKDEGQGETTTTTTTTSPEINDLGLAWVFLTPAGLGFLYGFDLGATSFVLAHLFLKQPMDDDDRTNLLYNNNHNDHSLQQQQQQQFWWSVSNLDQTWQKGSFIATLSLGAWFGSYLAFLWTHPVVAAATASAAASPAAAAHHRSSSTITTTTTNRFGNFFRNIGRRQELQFCSFLYVIGTLANVLSGTAFAYSSPTVGFSILVMGRLLFGMGVGFIMHGAPAYMAEMCPDQVRGAVVTAKEAMIVSGILMGYAIGNWLLGQNPSQQQQQNQYSPSNYDDMNDSYHYNMFGAMFQREGRWTAVYAVMLMASIPLLFLSLFVIPESHRWLLRQGRDDEALESLKFVYRTDTPDNHERVMIQFDRMVQGDHQHRHGPESSFPTSSPTTGPTSSFHHDSLRLVGKEQYQEESDAAAAIIIMPTSMISFIKILWQNHQSAFIAAMGLIFFQQLSGQPCILSYAPVIWNAAGWSGNASVVTALIMLTTAMGTVLLVDVIGRKRLLKACCVTMAVALFLLAMCFWQPLLPMDNNQAQQQLSQQDEDLTAASNGMFFSWMGLRQCCIVVGMFAYVAGYQIGFGPITWLVVSEVFPMDVRGPAIAAGVELNYLLNFMAQFALAGMQDTIGWGPTFLVFGIVVIMAWFFIHHHVPETNGLSLEDIEDEMAKPHLHSNQQHHHKGVVVPNKGEPKEKSSLLYSRKDIQHYMTMSTCLSSTSDQDEEEGTTLSINSSSDSLDV